MAKDPMTNIIQWSGIYVFYKKEPLKRIAVTDKAIGFVLLKKTHYQDGVPGRNDFKGDTEDVIWIPKSKVLWDPKDLVEFFKQIQYIHTDYYSALLSINEKNGHVRYREDVNLDFKSFTPSWIKILDPISKESMVNILTNRIKEHNSGSMKTTQSGKPWTLIYYEAFINKTDALIEEKFLKTGKGRERLNFLLKNSKVIP